MSLSNQLKFEREAFEYMAGKEGMVIDVRFNSGGNISDTLIDWIERKPHGYVRPRDGRPETAPYHAWEKRCLVLINEHSYSNGEMFPSAMRTRGLAKLIGMPTPGYVIWTSDMRLVDGTGARMPQSGVFRKRSDKCNRPVKTVVAAPPQIVLCLGLVPVSKSQLSEVVIDFPQPTRMRGSVSVFQAPS